jgi:hypothetical protein
VDHGRSVDTTMGFTPGEGLIMGTRCGDVDAGVLAFLERAEKLTVSQTEELLNKKSGLLGLSGISSDMREILKAADGDNPRALIALKTYCYRVRKYVGAYVAAMGGVDAVIFTGGIGQGSAEVRALALQGLDCMGITLDAQRNRDARGFDEVCRITTDDSKVAVLVVPTDEERMMAREALRTLGRSQIGHTQVEIAMTEQYKLGVQPPIRESGDVADTPGCTLEGPAGRVKLERGVICALRHIHMTPADALRHGVRDKSVVRVRIEGDRELIFGDVLVRVGPSFALAMHIDTDEANAANVKTGAQGYIDGIQSEG